MPYRPGFTPQQFDALKSSLGSLAAQGPFDANDALFYVLSTGITNNAGDVATILADLVDLGYLRRGDGDGDGGPHRFTLSEQP